MLCDFNCFRLSEQMWNLVRRHPLQEIKEGDSSNLDKRSNAMWKDSRVNQEIDQPDVSIGFEK